MTVLRIVQEAMVNVARHAQAGQIQVTIDLKEERIHLAVQDDGIGITDVVKASGNTLEVEVVNFWPNRIIGDQFLPPEARRTKTNIRKLTRDATLMESGLLGPVRLLEQH